MNCIFILEHSLFYSRPSFKEFIKCLCIYSFKCVTHAFNNDLIHADLFPTNSLFMSLP